MIKLITGLPGSGKSLSVVEAIQAFKRAGRTVYQHGVDGLKLGLAETLEDPLKWQDLPDGSVVIIDEAQKVFPARKMTDPIPPVVALSEHRHRGFDFIIVTQNPMFLDSFVRRLVGEHVHCVRRFGVNGAIRYTWNECVDDPQSSTMRSRAVESPWRYPKELFGLYESATLHTVKRSIPKRLVFIPLAMLASGFAIWFLLSTMAGWAESIEEEPTITDAAMVAGEPKKAGLFATSNPLVKMGQDRKQPLTTEQWAALREPRVPGVVATAPMFDQRQPTAEPELYCALSHGKGAPCRCITEQGTVALVEYDLCRLSATVGLYNPYRRPSIGAKPPSSAPSTEEKSKTLPPLAKPSGP